jgi:Tol biopolymer transport system component
VVVFSVVLFAAAAGAAQASFPGANGRIAYSSFGDDGNPRAIHTMGADGSDDRQLTHSGWARNPAWSPNGRLIAFDLAADGDGPARLYVMRASGRHKRRIPTGDLDARNPSWSPDGRRLVFQGCLRDSECEEDSIFVVGRRGRGLREIAADGVDPVWAPNGRWIAYAGKLREEGCRTIVLVRPSGRRTHSVLSDEPDESKSNFCAGASGLDYAPSSRKLVYLAVRARRSGSYPDPVTGEDRPLYAYDHAMYTVGVDGNGRRLVTWRAVAEFEYLLAPFAWSPDGDWLLWGDDRGTFVGHLDGGGERKIAGQGSGDEYAWQPLPAR